jgi:hypothetical protein
MLRATAGCFPGYGVYGPVLHNPTKCEECPAGSYSTGGALAPCQPCANDAFQYLTSAPGSTSFADCACAAGACQRPMSSQRQGLSPPATCTACPGCRVRACLVVLTLRAACGCPRAHTGFGVTVDNPTTCSTCERGYYNEGPIPSMPPAPPPLLGMLTQQQQQQQQEEAASQLQVWAPAGTPGAVDAPRSHPQPGQLFADVSSSSSSSTRRRSLQQVNPVFSQPTYAPCTFCGPGCDTRGPGATSAQDCGA